LGYFEKKEYEKAIESFNKAIEINPTFTDAYYNRGITYLMLDNDT
jgi:tetratricopeptide (TPR) repeat protein